MTTQMLVRYSTENYDQFRAAFDGDAEDRGNNGLTLLQLWRETGSQAAWALYQVSNAQAAREYLSNGAGAFNSQAGVSATQFHQVETA